MVLLLDLLCRLSAASLVLFEALVVVGQPANFVHEPSAGAALGASSSSSLGGFVVPVVVGDRTAAAQSWQTTVLQAMGGLSQVPWHLDLR